MCEYSNPNHGEPWFCLKPKSGECSPLIWQTKEVDTEKLEILETPFFEPGINYMVDIKGSGNILSVTKAKPREIKLTVTSYDSKASLDPMTPTGWFYKSKWTSTKLKMFDYNRHLLEKCIRNKALYFMGDSTIRQWYSYFVQELNLKSSGPDNSIVWSERQQAISRRHNLTMYYKSHGPPLHNPGPPSARPYITNSLDELTKGGKGTVVLITMGLHFELFDPVVFAERIRAIKQAAQNLIHRLPGIHIYIKGLHWHASALLCPSPWLSYRYDAMLRKEFEDIAHVTHVSMWDLTMLMDNQKLHPVDQILQKMIALFLSYIC